MKKFGIIGAMDVEVALFTKELQDLTITKIAKLDFMEGNINGIPVIVVKSGVGKVNAAYCAQILISCFNVTHIINTGAAGAFASGLGVLDIVVSTEVMHHDVDITSWGYKPCTLPDMTTTFIADSSMMKCAAEVCKEVFPERKCICGRIATGDQFICSNEQKNKIKEMCNPACVEMEGAAIAQVCSQNEIPFLILRCMSDMADDAGSQTAIFNEKTAGETSAALVTAFLKKYNSIEF